MRTTPPMTIKNDDTSEDDDEDRRDHPIHNPHPTPLPAHVSTAY